MAILEKLKYYSNLFLQYISTRFGIFKFIGFALLLVMLAADKTLDWEHYVRNFIFVFVSLFVFRMLDDLWSFHLDRKNHPERRYIQADNIKGFIVLCGIVYIPYQVILFIFSPALGFTILILFLVSSILYLLFYKAKNAMVLIPLFKYPVFIWCISKFSMVPEILLLSAGAFLMLLTYDFIDDNPGKKNKFSTKTTLLLITGILILQPWSENQNLMVQILLILTPLLIFVLPESKIYKFFPLLIFPIIHVLDLII